MKTQASEFLLALGEFALAKKKMIEETQREIEKEAKKLRATYVWVSRLTVGFHDEEGREVRDGNGYIILSHAYEVYLNSVDRNGFVANWRKEKGWY